MEEKKQEMTKELSDFVKKVELWQSLIDSEMRYFIFVSMISADALVDVESCEKSVESFTFLKDIDKLGLLHYQDDKHKKEVRKFIKDGFRIAKRDLKDFKKCTTQHQNSQTEN